MARPMTIAEKILAAHAGLDEVVPGQLIECDLDLVLSNDVTAPIAIDECRKITDRVWNPDRVVMVPDHYTPAKDIKSAELSKRVRDFVREQGISHYWEVGKVGIEHALLPEQGVCVPGDLIIGGRGPGYGPRLVQGARKHQIRNRRRTCPGRVGQRRDPAHHRHDRR